MLDVKPRNYSMRRQEGQPPKSMVQAFSQLKDGSLATVDQLDDPVTGIKVTTLKFWARESENTFDLT